RFPMCSTFKFLAIAAVLARVDARQEKLDRPIPFNKGDLLDYAPITKTHLRRGFMSVADLCAAAIEYSDNTAANLLLATIGGPQGVTRYARAIGDSVTRLDRSEPSLNTASPGDVRDTTTPAAMVNDMRTVLLGHVLSAASRGRLASWLAACQTGQTSIRAGVPPAWRAGDKTGSGDHGTSNDIAILWPPRRRPILVAAYLTAAAVSASERHTSLAEVGRIASSAFTR
ncbi:MAG TPA: class A beta-lactamase, partial [Candidatus Baltobacteraceae bacterium]